MFAISLLFYLVFRKRDVAPEERNAEYTVRGPFHRITLFLEHTADGFRGMTRVFFRAFGFSFLFLFSEALSFWLVSVAYGLRISLVDGLGVFLIIFLGTILPGTPGNVGVYQLFCVLGLRLFGVDKTAAAGFSLVFFFILSVPFWTLGCLALSKSGMTLYAITREIGAGSKRDRR